MALRSDDRLSRPEVVSVETRGPLHPSTNRTVARAMSPLLAQLFGGSPPVRIVFWDGSATGPVGGPGTLVLRAPRSLARLVWSPDELGMARGFSCCARRALRGGVRGLLRGRSWMRFTP